MSDACPGSADASPARTLAMERPDMRKNSGLEVCKYNESSSSSRERKADYSHEEEKRKERSRVEEG